MISYAQNFEDVILNRAFDGKTDGFYIDVGAWDPIVDSVTRHFYELGWRGINIEPASEPFQELERARPRDVNLNVALGARTETKEFYEVRDSGLSTLRADVVDGFAAYGLDHMQRQIDVLTLADVCRRHASGPIDFLKIDAEGWEVEVIRGGDWEHFRPSVLVVEAVVAHPSAFLGTGSPLNIDQREIAVERQSFISILARERYDLAYFDGLNEFYVAREASHLRSKIALPPNVFDAFVSFRQADAERRLADVSSEIESLRREVAARQTERPE